MEQRLLLVEDDLVFARVVSRALSQRGYDVSHAETLAAAGNLIVSQPFHYAILDLNLGGQTSLELIPLLTEKNPDIRILILTGYASVATAVEAIKLGAVHYLTKPADADEILAALHKDEGDAGVSLSDNPLTVKRLEWEHLQKVLNECGGNVSAAARKLRMHRRTLQRKLAKHPVRD